MEKRGREDGRKGSAAAISQEFNTGLGDPECRGLGRGPFLARDLEQRPPCLALGLAVMILILQVPSDCAKQFI